MASSPDSQYPGPSAAPATFNEHHFPHVEAAVHRQESKFGLIALNDLFETEKN